MPSMNTDNMADVVLAVAEGFVRDLAQAMHAEIVVRTPVKTGRAMGSWSASLASPAPVVNEGLNAPDRTANATEASARAIRQGQDVIRRFKLTPGSLIWITNAVPYMKDLEVGSSKQAPRGVCVQAIQSVMSRFGASYRPMSVNP
jgi:hypothetical protein